MEYKPNKHERKNKKEKNELSIRVQSLFYIIIAKFFFLRHDFIC